MVIERYADGRDVIVPEAYIISSLTIEREVFGF